MEILFLLWKHLYQPLTRQVKPPWETAQEISTGIHILYFKLFNGTCTAGMSEQIDEPPLLTAGGESLQKSWAQLNSKSSAIWEVENPSASGFQGFISICECAARSNIATLKRKVRETIQRKLISIQWQVTQDEVDQKKKK